MRNKCVFPFYCLELQQRRYTQIFLPISSTEPVINSSSYMESHDKWLSALAEIDRSGSAVARFAHNTPPAVCVPKALHRCALARDLSRKRETPG